jgi:hypothetical protein
LKKSSVVDSKLFITDPDPTFKKFRIRFRIRPFSSRNMILMVLKWHFKTYVLFIEYQYLLKFTVPVVIKIMKLLLFFMFFVNVYIHFRVWTWIRNPRVKDPDLAKVTDPGGSGSTTLITRHVLRPNQKISCSEGMCGSGLLLISCCSGQRP